MKGCIKQWNQKNNLTERKIFLVFTFIVEYLEFFTCRKGILLTAAYYFVNWLVP